MKVTESITEFMKKTKTFGCKHYRSPNMTALTCQQKRAETKLEFSFWPCDPRCKRYKLPIDKDVENAVKRAWEIDDPGFIPIKMSKVRRDGDIRVKFAMGWSLEKIAKEVNLSESMVSKIVHLSY